MIPTEGFRTVSCLSSEPGYVSLSSATQYLCQGRVLRMVLAISGAALRDIGLPIVFPRTLRMLTNRSFAVVLPTLPAIPKNWVSLTNTLNLEPMRKIAASKTSSPSFERIRHSIAPAIAFHFRWSVFPRWPGFIDGTRGLEMVYPRITPSIAKLLQKTAHSFR